MHRIPSTASFESPDERITYARLVDARQFNSDASVCDILAAPGCVTMEGGGLAVTDIEGYDHHFGPSVVGSVHIEEHTTISSSVDLKRAINPDLDFSYQALDLFKRMNGPQAPLSCDGCDEEVSEDDYAQAWIWARLAEGGCYATKVAVRHEKCGVIPGRKPRWLGRARCCTLKDAVDDAW